MQDIPQVAGLALVVHAEIYVVGGTHTKREDALMDVLPCVSVCSRTYFSRPDSSGERGFFQNERMSAPTMEPTMRATMNIGQLVRTAATQSPP